MATGPPISRHAPTSSRREVAFGIRDGVAISANGGGMIERPPKAAQSGRCCNRAHAGTVKITRTGNVSTPVTDRFSLRSATTLNSIGNAP